MKQRILEPFPDVGRPIPVLTMLGQLFHLHPDVVGGNHDHREWYDLAVSFRTRNISNAMSCRRHQ